MDLNQAKQLKYGNELLHMTLTNADGTPMRFKVNGAVKRWKRDKDRIRVPLKRGLWQTGYLVHNDDTIGRSFTFNIEELKVE